VCERDEGKLLLFSKSKQSKACAAVAHQFLESAPCLVRDGTAVVLYYCCCCCWCCCCCCCKCWLMSIKKWRRNKSQIGERFLWRDTCYHLIDCTKASGKSKEKSFFIMFVFFCLAPSSKFWKKQVWKKLHLKENTKKRNDKFLQHVCSLASFSNHLKYFSEKVKKVVFWITYHLEEIFL